MESLFSTASPKPPISFTFVTRNQVVDSSDPEEQMILNASSHKVAAKTLNVPELALEVERAVWQVDRSLKKERMLDEEKRHMEAADEQQNERRK